MSKTPITFQVLSFASFCFFLFFVLFITDFLLVLTCHGCEVFKGVWRLLITRLCLKYWLLCLRKYIGKDFFYLFWHRIKHKLFFIEIFFYIYIFKVITLLGSILVLVKIWCLILIFVGTFIRGVSTYSLKWNKWFLVLGTQFAGDVFLI